MASEPGPAGAAAPEADTKEPSFNAELTPELHQRAQKWVEEKWTRAECPFHGPTSWEVGNMVVQTVQYVPKGISIGGRTYPLVPVICRTCGYTVFLNALLMGIVPASLSWANRATDA